MTAYPTPSRTHRLADQLPLKIDGNKPGAGIHMFVARHAGLLDILPLEPCHAIWFTAECGHEETFSTASLGVSVVEAQLSYLELVSFNPIHHAVFVRDSA